eukprot:767503-Hanusia_phi.AAC.4
MTITKAETSTTCGCLTVTVPANTHESRSRYRSRRTPWSSGWLRQIGGNEKQRRSENEGGGAGAGEGGEGGRDANRPFDFSSSPAVHSKKISSRAIL